MPRFILHTSFDLCSGCESCLMACSFKFFDAYNPRHAMLSVTHKKEHLYHFPVVCAQCSNAYCANVCPVKAIERNLCTGAMIIDRDKCVGCGLCRQYCPIDMIRIDKKTSKAFKCDLCDGSPACVDACPTGALTRLIQEAGGRP